MQKIYLDNNSTTSLDPIVLEEMLKEMNGPPANPSSVHSFGRQAKQQISRARSLIASFFQVHPDQIFFTSGGTESLNTLLHSLPSNSHLITTKIEHAAVYQTVSLLQTQGLQVTYVPVDLWGAPRYHQVLDAIQPNTKAMIFSACNAETGAKLDLLPIANLAKEKNIDLWIDAISYIGKERLPILNQTAGFAISPHKFHGPKGIGILFIKQPEKLKPHLIGGGQEHYKRAGTEHVAGILGAAKAFEILETQQETITSHLLRLRTYFETYLKEMIPNLMIHGHAPRIANTSNVCFPGVDGETLLIQLDLQGIAASHGSACSSGSLEPSRVLTQMGVAFQDVRSSIRFSFAKTNTLSDIQQAVSIIVQTVKKLRDITHLSY